MSKAKYAKRYADLQAMKRDDLVSAHDELLGGTTAVEIGVNYYLQQIARLDATEQTDTMLEYTRQIRTLTIVMAVCTVIVTLFTLVNLILIALALFLKAPP